MISAGEDLHIFVSDVESQQRKHTFVGHGKLITDVACHPLNEDIFVTSSLDGTIKVWSMRDQSGPLNTIVMGQPVWSVTYNQNGDYLVAVLEHGTITLINCSKATEARRDELMQVV